MKWICPHLNVKSDTRQAELGDTLSLAFRQLPSQGGDRDRDLAKGCDWLWTLRGCRGWIDGRLAE